MGVLLDYGFRAVAQELLKGKFRKLFGAFSSPKQRNEKKTMIWGVTSASPEPRARNLSL